jgi:hypothetical protein
MSYAKIARCGCGKCWPTFDLITRIIVIAAKNTYRALQRAKTTFDKSGKIDFCQPLRQTGRDKAMSFIIRVIVVVMCGFDRGRYSVP